MAKNQKQNPDRFWVRIIEDKTGEVVKEMGPMSESVADKVADGASINLNHDEYSVKIEEDHV